MNITREIASGHQPSAGERGRTGTNYNAENALLLGVLDAVERNPRTTQRSVARELGVALGLANAYVKRCVRKGLIKVGQIPPHRYAYYLTPRGMTEKSRLTADYLSHSFSFFRQARAQCDELLASAVRNSQTRIALVGEGDLADIARLVASNHPITIVGVVRATDGADAFAALDGVDAAIITALDRSREAYLAAVNVLGTERVHAPKLLRIASTGTMTGK